MVTWLTSAMSQLGRGIVGALHQSGHIREVVSRPLRAGLTLSQIPSTAGPRVIYDAAAPLYPIAQGMWLSFVGGQAQERLYRELERWSVAEPTVLDVGSGDGRSAVRLGELQPDAKVVLTDISAGMLSTAVQVGPRVQASATLLPFCDDTFGMVVATWSLETMTSPERGLDECMRVAAPSGIVAVAYCSLPENRLYLVVTRPVRWIVERYFAGQFLDVEWRPFVPYEELYRWSTRTRLASVAIFRKPAGPRVFRH